MEKDFKHFLYNVEDYKPYLATINVFYYLSNFLFVN